MNRTNYNTIMIEKDPRKERIGMRVSREEKRLIEQTAKEKGYRSLADFFVDLVRKIKR